MPQNRVALIEDDTLQQIILKSMLEDHFNVQVFGNYQDAISSFVDQDAAPHLILCDMSLPDGDGIALRQELQKHDHLRSCPFIFLTSMDDGVIKKQAIDLGIDDYLRKPIDKTTLIDTLDRSLARNRQIQRAIDDHLNHQLTEPLQPNVPERIGSYKLALAHQEVVAGGGDFTFHLRAVDTDFIIMGDVMGHGAPAKFFLHAYAGYLYGMMQSFQHYHFTPTAADLLYILNKTLTTDPFLQRWLLTCVIVAMPLTGSLTMAQAGHPFAWHIKKDEIKTLGEKAVMPGLLKNPVFHNIAVELLPGERLLLTTDGARFDPILSKNLLNGSSLHAANALIKRCDTTDDATVLLIERV